MQTFLLWRKRYIDQCMFIKCPYVPSGLLHFACQNTEKSWYNKKSLLLGVRRRNFTWSDGNTYAPLKIMVVWASLIWESETFVYCQSGWRRSINYWSLHCRYYLLKGSLHRRYYLLKGTHFKTPSSYWNWKAMMLYWVMIGYIVTVQSI